MKKIMDIALGEIGQHEQAAGDNPRILEYLRSCETWHVGELADEVSWCSAFVNWCITKAGLTGTNSLAARSWLNWGEKLQEPAVGSVVILQRGSESWQGHVGFVFDYDKQYIHVLGGNQGNAVNVKPYRRDKVLGFRAPKEGL